MEEDREGLEEERREKDGWETGMQWRRVKTDGTKTSRGMRCEPCCMWRTVHQQCNSTGAAAAGRDRIYKKKS